MPKDPSLSTPRQARLASLLDPLVVVYQKRKVIIRRDADYQATLLTIKRSVRALAHVPASDIILKSNTIPHQDGEYVDISEDAWPDVVNRSYLRNIVVEIEESAVDPVPARTPTRMQPTQVSSPKFGISVLTSSGERIELNVKSTILLSAIHRNIAWKLGKCEDDFRLMYCGEYLKGDKTLAELNIEEGASIDMIAVQVGGKPVIYLSPPETGSAIDATVDLSLSQSWSLSALYPIRPGSTLINSSYGQETSWTVRAHANGVLYDKATETEVSYLYWEARTNPSCPLTPPVSPRLTSSTLAFDPSCAQVSTLNSVLLPVDKIPTYLDRALTALALHTEARTSFITYWLPSILKHTHVALRFVPQSEYEQAARLTVTPTPDVVTRVFMVFRGIQEGQLAEWTPAIERADDGVAFWKDIVGIDAQAAQDTSLFRVLEWGGMEVLNC